MHQGNEPCDEKCHCWNRGFCEKYCVCNPALCKKKPFSYCTCTSGCGSVRCPCSNAGRECDPEKCRNCCSESDGQVKRIECQNKSCQLKAFKKTAIARSNVAGWGLFALERISKFELIQEYTGEIIDFDQSEQRDKWNNVEEITYIFELNDNVTFLSNFFSLA
jgi:SET domain-containing protein